MSVKITDDHEPYESLPVFRNGDEVCIVLKQEGLNAITLRPNAPSCPYVVPMQYVAGEKDWWHGSYYPSLDVALEEYHIRVDKAARR